MRLPDENHASQTLPTARTTTDCQHGRQGPCPCLCSWRRILKALGLHGAVVLALMTLTAVRMPAQIINGDFESATDLEGWTVEWASVASCAAPSWAALPAPAGHPVASILSSTYATCGSFSVDPYEGSKMCRLNDAGNGCHATRISQTFPLRKVDKDQGGKLGIEWGAHLNDPGHTPENCQPYFSIVVRVNGSAYKSFSASASDASAGIDPGWTDVGCGFYYKKGIMCVDLSRCPTDAQITVEMTAADCGYCGHAGEAFLDNVRWMQGTPAPADMVGWWADHSLVDVTPEGNDGSWVPSVPWYAPGYVKSGLPFGCSPTPRYAVVPDDDSLDFGTASLTDSNGDFSIDAWVRPTDITGIRPIVSKMGHTTFTRTPGYQFYLEDGFLTLLLSQGGSASSTNFNIYTSVGAVSPGEWSFVGVTVDRLVSSGVGEVKFYVNGICLETEVSEVFNPNLPNDMVPSLANDAPLYLGFTESTYDGSAFLACVDACFEGYIDEIEIFSRALTCAEMTRLFQAGCCGKQRCDPAPTHTGGIGHLFLPWCYVFPWIVTPATPAWTPIQGNMFDIVTHDSVNVLGLQAHLQPGMWDVEVYTVAGSHVGIENNPTAWSFLGTAQGVRSAGEGETTIIPLQFSVPVAMGSTQAFYVRTVQGAGLNATAGPNLGAVYERGQAMDILSGSELAGGFTPGGSQSYLFNGTLIYEVTDGLVCDFCTRTGSPSPPSLSLDFIDKSATTVAGGALNWAWDFDGDGITDSTQRNPSFTYLAPGIYDVSLTVSDGVRVRSISKSRQVGDPAAGPTIRLTGPPQIGSIASLLLSSPPDAGRPYICGFSLGTTPGINVQGFNIPLNLDPLLISVFDVADPVSTLFSGTIGALDGNGQATCSMGLPPVPSLIGVTLYSAFVVIDPSTMSLSTVSPAAAITIQ